MFKEIILNNHIKKFVGLGGLTPVLAGIFYAADGCVYATNRHYAIRVRDAHKLSSPVILHAKTGAPIEGQYPDVEKVFNDVQYAGEFSYTEPKEFNQALFAAECALAVALKIDKRVPLIRLAYLDGRIHLFAKDEENTVSFRGFFGTYDKEDFPLITLNANYLANAMTVFSEIPFEVVKVRFSSPHNPILITDEANVDVIILPVRSSTNS